MASVMTSDRQEPRKQRRGIKRALVMLGVVVAVGLGTAGWALNRYVIDHVKIADVAAYEAKVSATSQAPTTLPAVSGSTAAVASATPTAPTATTTTARPVATAGTT